MLADFLEKFHYPILISLQVQLFLGQVEMRKQEVHEFLFLGFEFLDEDIVFSFDCNFYIIY